MNQHRLDVLRAFRESGWQMIPMELQRKDGQRAISWLVEKGFLERHPEHFITEVRITNAGYDVLAQAGGDVTGWG
ncbi:hypothetical protein DA075_06545 [Methylobacterium currus]|uniref:ArsR family transcriptional regulator n=1 Tax=Methylobacterium currus TaxID=2051553 RepID=A0A2R4WGG2_9HYPH|nr:hypothetical protein [Methylobacterium currus]AWB20623.1 hypothetical protein DA075_06545 [Methylobacterium currus]